MSLRLVTETIKSYLQTVILAWFVPFYNYMTSTSYVAILIALALALCGAAIFIMVLFRMYREKNAEIEPDVQVGNSRWAGDAILLGALGTLAGLLPAIALNRMVSLGSDTYDRYTLVAILGTIFLVIGAVCAITSSPLRRIVAVSILVLLSISSNYLNANSYRIKTQLARQLWWELTWRAPDLKDGTVVVPLLPRGFRFQDDFDIWPEANLIYRNRETDITIAGQVLNLETARSILAGVREVRNSRNLYFERNYKKTLVLYLGYDSENPSCLHVVNGADVELSQNEDPIIPYVASRSQIDQIDVNGKPHTPPELFFGAEPPHGWCYYYQKASLARQRGDWAEAARLGDEAAKQGFQPQDWVEWLPFLEAYQKMNRPGQVEQILNLYANKPDITRLICQHIPGAPGCG